MRKPIDREAVLQSIDSQILALLALKRMVEGLDDDEVAGPTDPAVYCEPGVDVKHDIMWMMGGNGVCRKCGAEFVEAPEDPGVSAPDAD